MCPRRSGGCGDAGDIYAKLIAGSRKNLCLYNRSRLLQRKTALKQAVFLFLYPLYKTHICITVRPTTPGIPRIPEMEDVAKLMGT